MKIKKFVVLTLFIFISSLAQSSSEGYATGGAIDLISINNDEAKISPNDDGLYDNINFNIDLHNKKAKVKKWEFVIVNKKTTNIVYNVVGKKTLPAVITWNGKDDSGNIIEGSYGYVFKAQINKKNINLTQDGIIVDITPPKLSIYLEKETFFINKKNQLEKEISFNLNVNDENKIDISKTSLKVFNSENKVVKEWAFSGVKNIPNIIYWDGCDDISGAIVSEGEYKAVFSAYDILGNGSNTSTEFKIQKITK